MPAGGVGFHRRSQDVSEEGSSGVGVGARMPDEAHRESLATAFEAERTKRKQRTERFDRPQWRNEERVALLERHRPSDEARDDERRSDRRAGRLERSIERARNTEARFDDDPRIPSEARCVDSAAHEGMFGSHDDGDVVFVELFGRRAPQGPIGPFPRPHRSRRFRGLGRAPSSARGRCKGSIAVALA